MSNLSFSVGDRVIGSEEPCFIIAEAGVNHNGDVEMALQLVDAAAEAGADAVKFQKRHLPSIYPKALLQDPNLGEWAFQYLLPILKETELSDESFRRIRSHCDRRSIRFMCSPWDVVSLDFLEELGVEVYKISSADLVNLPLLDAVADTGKPMILSTGMATQHEIEVTINYLKARKASFAVLHCVSAYPAPFEALNLRFMKELENFEVPVGYSGHERGISIPVVAATMGASIIEKHITLDRTLVGPDHAASIEPHGFRKMVRDIRIAEMSMGAPEKHLCQIEMLNRHVLRKSLVAARDFEMGHVVGKGDIKVRGPGKGISPQRIDDLIGVVLSRAISEDDYFVEGDLKNDVPETIDRDAFRRHQWGLKARFHDLEEVLKLHPPMVELHFTNQDIDHPFVAPKEPRPERMVIHAPEFFDKKLLDLAAESDEQRQRSIELLQRTIDKAAVLAPSFAGPMAVVIHVGGMSMDRPLDNTELLLRRAVDSFRQLDSKGVVLLPENLPPRPWYLGGQWYQNLFTRPEEMVEFCQALNLGMTLDLSHAQLYCTLAGVPLADYVQRCLPLSRHLHVADASGIDGEGLQIGEGIIEWDTILQLLENAEFSWVPEIWSGHLNGFNGFLEAFDRFAKMGGI